jgi:hypothetical protein
MKLTAIRWSALPVGLLVAVGIAMAQSSTPSTPPAQTKPDPTVHQRKENQQDRIANGVQSGQLTSRETANLETKEAAINGETRADRAANGGKLTPAERQQINRQQNHVSRQIYQDKHNANTAHHGNTEVGRRRENQQDRIAQGVRSGQLTAGETAHLENRERGINQQVHADRAANGGRLTLGERAQVNREQNRTSRRIYRDKHNAARQGKRKP